jgi:hypothetical protein
VAYSPPVQTVKNAYQPHHENDDAYLPSTLPPQRTPPPPPLKIPLTDFDDGQNSDQKQHAIRSLHSPRSESHQSKSSLDHELRQYQQYSERIHSLADSSVESLISYRQSREEKEDSSRPAEQYSFPSSETHKRQISRQEQAVLIADSSGDGGGSNCTREEEIHETTHDSVLPAEPSMSSNQHHGNIMPSLPGTSASGSPAPLIIEATPNQFALRNSLTQTKDHGSNESGRRSNNSIYRHSVNSHHSSSSVSEEESQLRSADAISSNSIITGRNPKIISIVSNQRHGEPIGKLTDMVSHQNGHHSASALGFGGPSDWEHFGDYEAEEVDDTDLYSRTKSEVATDIASDTAELPVDLTPVDKLHNPIQSSQVKSESNPNDAPHLSLHGAFSVDSPKRDHESNLSQDDSRRASGTESQIEAKVSDPAGPQSSTVQTEKAHPHVEILDVDETMEARRRSNDKTQEDQTSNSPYLGNIDISSDQPVKPSQDSQEEGLQSSDNSSDLSSRTLDDSQSKALIIRSSSNEPEAPFLAVEAVITDLSQQTEAPNHVKMDTEDDRVSPMVNESPSNMGQSKINQETPDDRASSQESDISNHPIADPRPGTTEEPLITVPDPNPAHRSSAPVTVCPEELVTHQVFRPDETMPLGTKEMNEIYADLDPWGRASLHRYLSMLHDEAKAESHAEKLKIFTSFANREAELRAALFTAEADAKEVQVALNEDASKHAAEPTPKRSEKALPALPPDSGSDGGQAAGSSTAQPVSESKSENLSQDPMISLPIDPMSDETPYSPGGRPLISRQTKDDNPENPVPELKTSREKVSRVLTQFASYLYPVQSTSPEAPKIMVSVNDNGAQKSAYIPYKYNQTEAEAITYLSKRQSAYRPYAALTMDTLDSKSYPTVESANKQKTMGESSVSESQEGNRQENQPFGLTTCIPEVAEFKKNNQTRDKQDLRHFVQSDFDPLNSVLPSFDVIMQDSPKLQELQRSMDEFPDDFSFIHQSVVAWDAVAKKERERFDRERHIRQGESERKIDKLFNDNEIGYGDISELEGEFKRSEASRKADEDRHEYQTFLAGVFDVVWTRLNYEIDHLNPLYDKYTTSINDSLVGKDMFEASPTQFPLAPLMSDLLALHQKLEVRHQKAFEAVLERDRRLKKTEVSAWYTLGNVGKVKELEKHFEGAEKNAIVAYCQQRDERANKLMDVLDHNTLRGVGANQDYMQCLMKAVRRVASGRAFASIPSTDPRLGVEEVKKAKSITRALARSSEEIVRTFHVADMLLNAADYELSIAKAKLANADPGTFKQLKEERTKEDQKLMRDLERRLALIRKDTRMTLDEVAKLLAFLGVEAGQPEVENMVIEKIIPPLPSSSSSSGPERVL